MVATRCLVILWTVGLATPCSSEILPTIFSWVEDLHEGWLDPLHPSINKGQEQSKPGQCLQGVWPTFPNWVLSLCRFRVTPQKPQSTSSLKMNLSPVSQIRHPKNKYICSTNIWLPIFSSSSFCRDNLILLFHLALRLVNSFEDPYQEFINMKDIYWEDHNQVNQGEKFKSFATKGIKHKSLPGGEEVYVPCLAYVKKIKTRFTT